MNVFYHSFRVSGKAGMGQEKIKQGKSLYNRVMHQDIRIRQNVDASYVMHGTYHHLANSLSVGWHVDFSKKLRHLLKGDIQS